MARLTHRRGRQGDGDVDGGGDGDVDGGGDGDADGGGESSTVGGVGIVSTPSHTGLYLSLVPALLRERQVPSGAPPSQESADALNRIAYPVSTVLPDPGTGSQGIPCGQAVADP